MAPPVLFLQLADNKLSTPQCILSQSSCVPYPRHFLHNPIPHVLAVHIQLAMIVCDQVRFVQTQGPDFFSSDPSNDSVLQIPITFTSPLIRHLFLRI